VRARGDRPGASHARRAEASGAASRQMPAVSARSLSLSLALARSLARSSLSLSLALLALACYFALSLSRALALLLSLLCVGARTRVCMDVCACAARAPVRVCGAESRRMRRQVALPTSPNGAGPRIVLKVPIIPYSTFNIVPLPKVRPPHQLVPSELVDLDQSLVVESDLEMICCQPAGRPCSVGLHQLHALSGRWHSTRSSAAGCIDVDRRAKTSLSSTASSLQFEAWPPRRIPREQCRAVRAKGKGRGWEPSRQKEQCGYTRLHMAHTRKTIAVLCGRHQVPISKWRVGVLRPCMCVCVCAFADKGAM